ncbi:MAG: hypothetical protein LAO18_10985 [Acidobacteriia bacterium]|jgi:hypothetical protein|nr:hypothetical protein [Terriglobia bacterium]
MTTLQEFRSEVCGLVTSNPTHWFVIDALRRPKTLTHQRRLQEEVDSLFCDLV